MITNLSVSESLLWDAAWQSTLFLSAGLLMAAWYRSRAARAHRMLLLAIIGTWVAPVASRYLPVAPFAPRIAPIRTTQANVADVLSPLTADFGDYGEASAPRPSGGEIRVATPAPDSHKNARVPEAVQPPRQALTRRNMFVFAWSAASVGLLCRLAVSFFQGLRLKNSGRVITEDIANQALERAAGRLNLDRRPRIYLSTQIQSPVIWCWSVRPVILIPETLCKRLKPNQWDGILLHELSHWKRGDHWTTLLAQLTVALIPWSPLAWVTKRLMANFSERACDSLVLKAGENAEDYAELILGLFPRKSNLLALPMLRSRKRVQLRVEYLLSGSHLKAEISKGWSWMASGSFVLLTLFVVCLGAPATAQDRGQSDGRSDGRTEVPSDKPMGLARRVELPEGLEVSNLSPNGRFLACFSSYTDLIIYEIETGKRKRLDGNAWPSRALWSYDSTELAYISGESNASRFQLVRLNLNTGEKAVIKDLQATYFNLEDWSRDGRYMVATEHPNPDFKSESASKHRVLLLVSTADGTLQEIPTSTPVQSTTADFLDLHPRFSPDGKYIVYKDLSGEKTRLVITTVNQDHTDVYSGFGGAVDSPFWSTAGDRIVFRGYGVHDVDLWAIRVRDGRFIGTPVNVYPQLGHRVAKNLTASSHLAIDTPLHRWGIFILPYDPERHAVTGEPVMVHNGGTRMHGWSADGKRLYHPDWNGLQAFTSSGSAAEVLALDPKLSHLQSLEASADGKFLYADGINVRQEQGIFRIDLAQAKAELVLRDNGQPGRWGPFMDVSLSRNGLMAYQRDRSLIVQTLSNGEERTVVAADSDRRSFYLLSAISPDGKRLAYVHYHFSSTPGTSQILMMLKVVDIATGGTKDLVPIRDGTPKDLDWLPNGRELSLVTDTAVWIVDATSGEQTALKLPESMKVFSLSLIEWAPHGKAFSFVSGYTPKPQYWIVENFNVSDPAPASQPTIKPTKVPTALKPAAVALVRAPSLQDPFENFKAPGGLLSGKETDVAYKLISADLGGIQNGVDLFTDRRYKFVDLPEELKGLPYLQTLNGHRAVWDKRFEITLRLDSPSWVFLGIENRTLDYWSLVGQPEWFRGFRPTDYKIKSDHPYTARMEKWHQLFVKEFGPGEFSLGAYQSMIGTDMCFALFGQE